jgi:hypothetical protein
VTLTVSYGFSGSSLDLSNGLDLSYRTDLYKAVVAVPSSEAVIGGAAVTLAVTYNDIGDAEGAEKSRTVYSVNVVRAPAEDPVFEGTVSKEGLWPGTISFSESDFTDRYIQNDGGEITHVRITGSNLLVGRLQVSGSDYTLGEAISVDELDDLTFVTAASGVVSYDVKAFADNDTSAPIGAVVLTVTVSGLSVPEITGTLSKTVAVGSSVYFPASTFTGLCDLNGGTLDSVEITPGGSSYGTWYVSGSAFSGTKEIAAADLSGLYFKGTAAGSASFGWRVSNAAGFSVYGTGTVAVAIPSITLSSYSAASLLKGETWTIYSSQFASSPAAVSLSYVKITTAPTSSDGYLYLAVGLPKNDTYGYPAIAEGKTLATGAVIPYGYLSYLRLATKSSAKNSSVSFAWTATTDSNVKSAAWASAAASYTVSFAVAGSVSCETDLNTPFRLGADEFSDAFYYATGNTLSYITLTLPSASYGKLYYNYDTKTGKGTAVSASKKYYMDQEPLLSAVTFVPVEGYTGTVSTSYKAYSGAGYTAEGSLTISVVNSPGGTVSYTTDKNEGIQLDAEDFAEAFQKATEGTLAYVKFTLPSSSYGKMYYDYISSSNFEATVSSDQKYYVYSSLYLSRSFLMTTIQAPSISHTERMARMEVPIRESLRYRWKTARRASCPIPRTRIAPFRSPPTILPKSSSPSRARSCPISSWDRRRPAAEPCIISTRTRTPRERRFHLPPGITAAPRRIFPILRLCPRPGSSGRLRFLIRPTVRTATHMRES